DYPATARGTVSTANCSETLSQIKSSHHEVVIRWPHSPVITGADCFRSRNAQVALIRYLRARKSQIAYAPRIENIVYPPPARSGLPLHRVIGICQGSAA